MAVFGGGCFWCTAAVFVRVRGVIKVISGYAGGKRENPTYEQVSSQATGHAEVIQIEFDSSVISYEELLDIFWHVHDPTTLDQQGYDRGSQYRSVIFTTSAEQLAQAQSMLQKLESSHEFSAPIVTQILPLEAFYTAEECHQSYYESNKNQPYCQLVIEPKIQLLLEKYQDKVK